MLTGPSYRAEQGSLSARPCGVTSAGGSIGECVVDFALSFLAPLSIASGEMITTAMPSPTTSSDTLTYPRDGGGSAHVAVCNDKFN
eukprot:2141361-Pleurochrysis_carterae.AAC.4